MYCVERKRRGGSTFRCFSFWRSGEVLLHLQLAGRVEECGDVVQEPVQIERSTPRETTKICTRHKFC
jgi:hypothetical protein